MNATNTELASLYPGYEQPPVILQIVEVHPMGSQGQQGNLSLLTYLGCDFIGDHGRRAPVILEKPLRPGLLQRIPQELVLAEPKLNAAVEAWIEEYRPDLSVSPDVYTPGYTWSGYIEKELVVRHPLEAFDLHEAHRVHFEMRMMERGEMRTCYVCGAPAPLAGSLGPLCAIHYDLEEAKL